MAIISTKCPILNKHFRETQAYTVPDLEVLVRVFEDALTDENVSGIICPEYDAESKACNLKKDKPCQYAKGFKNV